MSMRRAYFIVTGIIAHVLLLFSFVLVAKFFDLTPRQFAYRLVEKSGLEQGILRDFITNSDFVEEQFPAPLRPEFTTDSPRFLQQTAFLQKHQPRVDFSSKAFKSYNPCLHKGPMWDTACFLVSKQAGLLETIKQRMLSFEIVAPNASGHHSNGWQLAFIYDSIKSQMHLSAAEKAIIEQKLKQAITHYLLLLNDDSPSLWHGRTTLSAQMWLCFIALDNPPQGLNAQVSAHFYAMIEALEITEGWPEGYNYWINTRAFYVALALSSYLQGTEVNIWHERIVQLIRRVGLWHIYATRPDDVIEGLGDEGPRIDLKDETRRVVDIFHQSTGFPALSTFSEYLQQLHNRESYYRGYRWGWSLFNAQVMYGNAALDDDVARLNLPQMDTFGAPYFGQTYIHQNWSPSRTFISYRAGDSFTHHGHYDNGHLSLFKGAPLLVNSSQYQGFTQENRLNYSIRSIAKNTIMVDRPSTEFDAGGQRVTQPLGSAILSPKHWFEQRVTGRNLAGGEITASFHHDSISFIASDLTRAYDSTWFDSQGSQGKLTQVKRSLLYLHELDTLFIKDDVQTTSDQFPVSLIFHTVNRPEATSEQVVEGVKNNGISLVDDQRVKVSNGDGRLTLEFLSDFEHLKFIGGDDYKFYVKSNHLAADKSGRNMIQGLSSKSFANAASWRIQLQLTTKDLQSSMVSVARPSLSTYSAAQTQKISIAQGQNAYVTGDVAVAFHQNPATLEDLPIAVKRVYMCDESVEQNTCMIYQRNSIGSWYAK